MKIRKFFGGTTLLILAAILYLGLWPNNVRSPFGLIGLPRGGGHVFVVFPRNEVSWLQDGTGLHFGDYGSIFSAADFSAPENSGGGCTLELWLEPEVTEDFTTTLAFSTKQNPLQFRLRQLEDSLSVSREILAPDGKTILKKIWVEHVFHEHRRVEITLSSGANGTAVYLNGELRKNYSDFRFTAEDFTGRLVFGNSPLGHETWGGNLRGLAIFPEETDAETAKADFESWNANNSLPETRLRRASAGYFFKERTGNVTRSEVAGAPDLKWPVRFQVLRPEFLKPFWKEYDGNLDYWVDFGANIVAFVPFGFVLCGYLRSRGIENGLLVALAAGFLVSLTIEVGQYYLPLRNSGTTDLFTNTTGTMLGAILFRSRLGQKSVDWLGTRLGNSGGW